MDVPWPRGAVGYLNDGMLMRWHAEQLHQWAARGPDMDPPLLELDLSGDGPAVVEDWNGVVEDPWLAWLGDDVLI